MVATLSTVQPKTEFGDIQGVMRHVFPSIRDIVCVDEVVPCFPCTFGLCKNLYGAKYGTQCTTPRKRRLSQEAWAMMENIGQPALYDLESKLAKCAHVLCYTYLLVNDVLGDSSETEALHSACGLLHVGVPLGLLPRRPYPLLLYIF